MTTTTTTTTTITTTTTTTYVPCSMIKTKCVYQEKYEERNNHYHQ